MGRDDAAVPWFENSMDENEGKKRVHAERPCTSVMYEAIREESFHEAQVRCASQSGSGRSMPLIPTIQMSEITSLERSLEFNSSNDARNKSLFIPGIDIDLGTDEASIAKRGQLSRVDKTQIYNENVDMMLAEAELAVYDATGTREMQVNRTKRNCLACCFRMNESMDADSVRHRRFSVDFPGDAM